MLYPAPNAGGLIAAVLTHALLINGSRESDRQARLKASEQILEPYQPTIEKLDAAQLTTALQSRWSADQAHPTTPARIVHVQPHFRVSADHRVIVMDARIRVQEPDLVTDASTSDRLVQVVSTPGSGEDPLASWLDNDAHHFREEIVALLAHGIDIALKLPHQPGTAVAARTQRYVFGNETRMERGQQLASGCGRVVLWTLRESLMSVPLAGNLSPCTNRYELSEP